MWWAQLAKAAWVATLARDRFQPGGVMADRAGMRRPGTITLATTVMVIRAVIGLFGIVLVFVVKDDIRQAIENSDHGLSASEVDTATNLAIGIALVFAVLVFLFYLWLATKIRSGRNWARIATIVIAALGVLGAIGTAVRPTANAARGGGLLTGALDLIVLIALATPSASAWCHHDRTVARYR
jgi:uncharacterized BrkB/YihY/UPF0761 family membrane protein